MNKELLDDLNEQMATDAKIDYGNLGHESIKTPSLYAKWQKIYQTQVKSMLRLESELKQLHLHLKLYYEGKAPDSVLQKYPMPKYIENLTKTKTEIESHYIKADPFYCEKVEALEFQRSIVLSIEGYMKNSISNRTFAIKNAIDYIKFQNGG